MVDFICMGLLDLQGAKNENYKMKILSHSGSRTNDPLNYKATIVPVRLSDLIILYYRYFKT